MCPPGPGKHSDNFGACLQPKRKLTSTKNVWPWSYLAPWMEADMTQRQAAKSGAAGAAGSAGTDSYDNSLFMPLRQFIEEPIVKDLLHNGAALQVSHSVLPNFFLPTIAPHVKAGELPHNSSGIAWLWLSCVACRD